MKKIRLSIMISACLLAASVLTTTAAASTVTTASSAAANIQIVLSDNNLIKPLIAYMTVNNNKIRLATPANAKFVSTDQDYNSSMNAINSFNADLSAKKTAKEFGASLSAYSNVSAADKSALLILYNSALPSPDPTATTINVSKVVELPDGGTETIYYIDGMEHDRFEAPQGFCPLDGTAAQLEEYGFDPRPTDASALAAWQDKYKDYHENRDDVDSQLLLDETAAQTTAEDTANSAYCANYNWAGYEFNPPDKRATGASAEFRIPTLLSNNGLNHVSVSCWVGLGGDGAPLLQSGIDTGYDATGSPFIQSWYEYINSAYAPGTPAGGIYEKVKNSVAYTSGDLIQDSVSYNASTATFYYCVSDLTNANHTTYNEGIPDMSAFYSGSSAEFTTEFPSGPVNIPQFGPVNWNGCYYNDNGVTTYLTTAAANYMRNEVIDTHNDKCIATSSITDSTNAFTNTYNHIINNS